MPLPGTEKLILEKTYNSTPYRQRNNRRSHFSYRHCNFCPDTGPALVLGLAMNSHLTWKPYFSLHIYNISLSHPSQLCTSINVLIIAKHLRFVLLCYIPLRPRQYLLAIRVYFLSPYGITTLPLRYMSNLQGDAPRGKRGLSPYGVLPCFGAQRTAES